MSVLFDTPFRLTEDEILTSAASTLCLSGLQANGVQEKRVGDLCSTQYGFTASAATEAVGPHFVRITDVKGGQIDWRTVPFCDCPNPEGYLLTEGDVLVARSGSVGKSFLVTSVPLPAVFASYMIRLRPNQELDSSFLYWCLQSEQFWQQILGVRRGSGMMNINGKMLGDLQFPCPPVSVQREIVTFLDAFRIRLRTGRGELPFLPSPLAEQRRIVARIEALAGKIAEARGLRRGAVEELRALSLATLDGVYDTASSTNCIVPLEEICSTITDGDHFTPSFADTGVKFIFVGNVSSGQLHFNGCKYVTPEYYAALREYRKPKKGDVLYSAVGATLGIPAIVEGDDDFCFQRHVALIRPDAEKLSAKYLWYMLRSGILNKKAWASTTGSAQPTIPLRAIRALPIPLPPLTEQQNIVAYLDGLQTQVDALKTLQAETAAELDALLPAVLDKAFKGGL